MNFAIFHLFDFPQNLLLAKKQVTLACRHFLAFFTCSSLYKCKKGLCRFTDAMLHVPLRGSASLESYMIRHPAIRMLIPQIRTPFFFQFRGWSGRPRRSLTVKLDKDHEVITFMAWKRQNIRLCVNRALQIPLALSHNTTGSSGNSTPELEFTQLAENILENSLGLGLRSRRNGLNRGQSPRLSCIVWC